MRSRRRAARLWVIAAPSGAGKTSLARALLEREPRLEFSISYTTRKRRSSEVDGRDYFFVDAPTNFKTWCGDDAFLEHAQVFDNWYGTGREHVERLLDSAATPCCSRSTGRARARFASARPALDSIFILPPNVAELERRLRGRATDTEATIQRRLRDSLADMTHWERVRSRRRQRRFRRGARAASRPSSSGRDAALARADLPAVRAAAAADSRRALPAVGTCWRPGVLH